MRHLLGTLLLLCALPIQASGIAFARANLEGRLSAALIVEDFSQEIMTLDAEGSNEAYEWTHVIQMKRLE